LVGDVHYLEDLFLFGTVPIVDFLLFDVVEFLLLVFILNTLVDVGVKGEYPFFQVLGVHFENHVQAEDLGQLCL
jgi:hypothetical protein